MIGNFHKGCLKHDMFPFWLFKQVPCEIAYYNDSTSGSYQAFFFSFYDQKNKQSNPKQLNSLA